MAIVILQQGQGLMDVAVQHCGDAGALFSLALANGLSITEELSPGTILELPEVSNVGIKKYFSDKELVPATGEDSNKKFIELSPEGVDYWAISEDFIIQ